MGIISSWNSDSAEIGWVCLISGGLFFNLHCLYVQALNPAVGFLEQKRQRGLGAITGSAAGAEVQECVCVLEKGSICFVLAHFRTPMKMSSPSGIWSGPVRHRLTGLGFFFFF